MIYKMESVKYNIVDDNKSSKAYGNQNNENNFSQNTYEEKGVDFEKLVKDYVSKNKPSIYILTPCYGGVCHVDYLTSLINTIGVLQSLSITVNVEFCKNDSLVSRARNNLIAKAMTNKETTHIIFIDNDISWEVVSILKLLVSDKHIIGGVYPLKHYEWSSLLSDPLNPYNSNIVQNWINNKNKSQLKNIVNDNEYIQNKLLKYNVNFLGKELKIQNNITKVKHVATGFMMIKREVVEKMFLAFPSTKYVDDVNFLEPKENENAYALFDCGVEEGHYMSEDWLFCSRWSKMGGDIYIDVSVNLTHIGVESYKGCFISSLL